MMMTMMRRMCAGSAGTPVTLRILSGTPARVAGASSLFTRTVSFSGLITVTLANARFVLFFESVFIIIGFLMY